MKKEKAIELKETLPDNVLTLKPSTTNVNIDGEVISLGDLEKIFFLSKLSNDATFISSILKIPVKRIDTIIHSLRFTEIMNEYLSEYMIHNVGETPEALTIRYKDFLHEVFTSLRITVGMEIRKAIELDQPITENKLHIPYIEKIMKLEFALHGLPISLKGVFHVNKTDSKDKSTEELEKNVKKLNETLSGIKDKSFSPEKIIDASVVEKDENENENEIKEDGEKEII